MQNFHGKMSTMATIGITVFIFGGLGWDSNRCAAHPQIGQSHGRGQ
jgi:hypothetical protein